MGEEASFALGPPRLPPHGRGGLLRFGTTGGLTAWAWGPPSLWEHRSPHRTGEWASFNLGPPRPPAHGRGDLFRFGTTEALTALARGPPSLCDRVGLLPFGTPSPPAHGRWGLLRFGTTEVPTAWGLLRFGTTGDPTPWAWGPPSLWDHRGARRMGLGASFALGH